MDWQLTCRVCLGTGDMVSLFDWDENNEQLSEKFTYCCGIEVSKNDSLPTLICLSCVDRLVYSYQFKQQCLSSNETLKECLEEFQRSSQAVASSSKATETETITIKQENGLLLQYEVPVEHEPQLQWTKSLSRTAKTPTTAVVTKAPGPRKRGRPRKYPNEHGQIDVSPYTRKKPKSNKEEESLTSLLASGTLELKEEPETSDNAYEDYDTGGDFHDDDPDFEPEQVAQDDEGIQLEKKKKKRGRPASVKKEPKTKERTTDDGEDVLLKETILAFSEPLPDHILNPKPKVKKPYKKRVHSLEKTHTCETCGASFTSNASLQAHIRRHLGIKPFVCSICPYTAFRGSNLRKHMRVHTGVKPYKCRQCPREFSDSGSRTKHESMCGYSTPRRENLRVHMRIHTGAKPFKCRQCPREFRDSGSRTKHESICGYSSVRRPNLRAHMRVHTGAKPYKCSLCPREFSDAGSRNKHQSVCGYSCVMNEELKRHMLRHTGEKPYKCRICERRFGDYGTRQKHERLHMGIRPYQCSLCGKSFTYSYVLSNHMLIHTGEKKYSCEPCNKKFTKAHHLKYHNKVHHKDLYIQQQIEAEAKKFRRQMNVTGLSGVVSGQIIDGKLQLMHVTPEENEVGEMQVVEECSDTELKETHQAVADMQAVVLEDAEFSIEDDSQQ